MSGLPDLLAIARMQEMRALSDHAEALRKERAAQDEIDRLAALQRAAFADEGADAARRQIGADKAWGQWLGRRRALLNNDALRARVMAAFTADRARHGLARRAALDHLSDRAETARRAERHAAEERARQALGLLAAIRDKSE